MYKFKKSIAYILLIVIIASTSSAFAQSKPMRYPEPEGKGFYYYFNDAYWTRRKNQDILWQQFMCHARYGTLKEVWNLEPFRESSDFIDCN